MSKYARQITKALNLS